MQQTELICVRNVKGKGRSVFARCAIKKGAIIERVPILLLPIEELVAGKKSRFLNTYCYLWNKKHVAVALGYGSLYNHSFDANARYTHGANMLTYRALRHIEKGEEVTINYNYTLGDQTPMWFKTV